MDRIEIDALIEHIPGVAERMDEDIELLRCFELTEGTARVRALYLEACRYGIGS